MMTLNMMTLCITSFKMMYDDIFQNDTLQNVTHYVDTLHNDTGYDDTLPTETHYDNILHENTMITL
jgi:hypothetical protein